MPSVRAVWLVVCSSCLLLACGGGGSGGGGGGGSGGGAGGGSGGGGGGAGDTTGQLTTLKAKSIYFGHQSVGWNLVQGVEDLLAAVPDPLQVGLIGDLAPAAGRLVHQEIGGNGDPASKMADFKAAVLAHCAELDVALMKLCWADDPGAGAQALFDEYLAMVEELQAPATGCPAVKLAHVTMPLTTGDNTTIEAYNGHLRGRFGATLFDLATEESTRPDGTRCRNGAVAALCDGYHPADDGGHLNVSGRDRMAARLVAFLAGLD